VGGGGRPNLAQGAGRDADKVNDALEFVRNAVKDKLAQKNLNGFG
jgi:alanyl-tRNA synthetase